jgi:hypothetical protein
MDAVLVRPVIDFDLLAVRDATQHHHLEVNEYQFMWSKHS